MPISRLEKIEVELEFHNHRGMVSHSDEMGVKNRKKHRFQPMVSPEGLEEGT